MQGIIIAGLSGGSGKSVVAVGLTAFFARQGHRVLPFKKGPDYIDAGWLSLAAGADCFNLDPFLMSEEQLLASYRQRASTGEIIVVEGNRGLYDGVDAKGGYSTAELAKLLKLPVLLVVDCTKTTRTVAALVLGCKMLDPAVDICGVVLNRIGSPRHERIVRVAVETYAQVPVVGSYRRLQQDIFPMRHLGVTPFQEYDGSEQAIADLAQGAAENLDIGAIKEQMAEIALSAVRPKRTGKSRDKSGVRIGIIRDAAFQFYYPENIIALQEKGAEIVEISSLTTRQLPDDIHALYIGGGFPETSAKLLADNVTFRDSIKTASRQGMPIYAECGGLIYLGEDIVLEGESYAMVGIFPVHFTLERRPQAHGYTVLTARQNNPFYPAGTEIKGHEFRYSRVANWPGKAADLGFQMERGVGFSGGGDGLISRNTMALYTHVHAVGTPQWADGIWQQAVKFKG